MKILVVRLSAIGDLVMASPLISTLKTKFPDAEIHWLAQPECAPVLNTHPELSSVITWPRQEWRNLWKQRRYRELIKTINQFRHLLHQQHFDLVLDIQGLLKSGILTWFTGAPRRIGLGSKEGSRIFMTEVVSRMAANADRIGSEYQYLAEHLGCETSGFEMSVTPSDASIANAMQLLRDSSQTEPFVVLCPFTTRAQKHWIDASWLELANALEKQQISCVMLGGPGDKEAAKPLSSHSNITSLVGKTSLPEAAAIINSACALIGVDTGLTHIGHAMSTPTIALFGSTRPYTDAGVTSSKVIYHERDCSPCRRNPTCEGRFDCMQDITSEEVMIELAEKLSILQNNSIQVTRLEPSRH